MKRIPKEQVLRRLRLENPWWRTPHVIPPLYRKMRQRAYFDLFLPLIKQTEVRRAVLLMGPRRVGKTVLIHHAIQRLLEEGIPAHRICYLSVDHPIYTGCALQDLLDLYRQASRARATEEPTFVFFDEIQYLKGWEVHLKTLVDGHPTVKFIASGSAAAALRLKSNESGAGRFTDFLLPPLTFHEYLDLLRKTDLVETGAQGEVRGARSIRSLNNRFLHYLNFGGYPEVIFSREIRSDPARFIKADIVDKVLLRDLPSLYGIQDTQELNHLFTTLAFNTANEISLEQLSQSSGVAKNTIKKYIEYLEAAFLIRVVHRIDRSGKRFQRANFFKVYLTNPSMRSALFSPIAATDEAVGPLAETGIVSQWFHMTDPVYYARWNRGEIDIVKLDERQKPYWAVEVKWSDRYAKRPGELSELLSFCKRNKVSRVVVTTKTVSLRVELEGIPVEFIPASLYCFTVGYNIVRSQRGRLLNHASGIGARTASVQTPQTNAAKP